MVLHSVQSGQSLEITMQIWNMIGYQGEAVLYNISISIFELIGKRLLTHNYEHTLDWCYIDEQKLIEHVWTSRVGVERILKAFQKATKYQHSLTKE